MPVNKIIKKNDTLPYKTGVNLYGIKLYFRK
jgi:hypothetical protein